MCVILNRFRKAFILLQWNLRMKDMLKTVCINQLFCPLLKRGCPLLEVINVLKLYTGRVSFGN